jgi:hypothetical protein
VPGKRGISNSRRAQLINSGVHICKYCLFTNRERSFRHSRSACSKCLRMRSRKKACSCGGLRYIWGCFNCGPRPNYIKVIVQAGGIKAITYRRKSAHYAFKTLKSGERKRFLCSWSVEINRRCLTVKKSTKVVSVEFADLESLLRLPGVRKEG